MTILGAQGSTTRHIIGSQFGQSEEGEFGVCDRKLEEGHSSFRLLFWLNTERNEMNMFK